MSNADLVNIFDECVDRLAAGESIDACLVDFPQVADVLRPMLETGLLVQRARVPSAETAEAQARVRPRFEEALRAAPIRRIYPLRRLVTLAASLLIVLFVAAGGATAYAQNALPGDALYGLKLFSENARLAISGEGLRQQFAERRVLEVRELLAINRVESVVFQGILSSQDGFNWVVAGIAVQVNAATTGAETVNVGDLIEVRGVTVGVVIAQEIVLIEAEEESVLPPSSATITPSASMTPTVTPSPTRTPDASPTATATEWPTVIFLTATPACGVQPDGWVVYRVRSGDTLSFLSSSRGITIEELMAVNCLTDARRIFVGQELFLPPGAPAVQPSGSSQSSGGSSPFIPWDDDDDDDDDDDGDDDDDDEDEDESAADCVNWLGGHCLES